MHTNTEYEHSCTFNGLDNVASMTDKIEAMVARTGTENTVFVLQLYDNSVFMVGGPGGESYHPVQDKKGIYHIDGCLVVANKDAVKELTALLLPLLKVIGASMKLVVAPLWLAPCCDDEDHVVELSLHRKPL